MNAVGGALEACPSHILKHRLAVHIVASLPSHDELACQFVEGGSITHIWRRFCAPEGVLQDFISKISKKLSMLKRAYSCLVEIISPSEPW